MSYFSYSTYTNNKLPNLESFINNKADISYVDMSINSFKPIIDNKSDISYVNDTINSFVINNRVFTIVNVTFSQGDNSFNLDISQNIKSFSPIVSDFYPQTNLGSGQYYYIYKDPNTQENYLMRMSSTLNESWYCYIYKYENII